VGHSASAGMRNDCRAASLVIALSSWQPAFSTVLTVKRFKFVRCVRPCRYDMILMPETKHHAVCCKICTGSGVASQQVPCNCIRHAATW
jgi:Na+-translocating ferredoxin:NAD+ oxidoreductase RNF subunit RnfB